MDWNILYWVLLTSLHSLCQCSLDIWKYLINIWSKANYFSTGTASNGDIWLNFEKPKLKWWFSSSDLSSNSSLRSSSTCQSSSLEMGPTLTWALGPTCSSSRAPLCSGLSSIRRFEAKHWKAVESFSAQTQMKSSSLLENCDRVFKSSHYT